LPLKGVFKDYNSKLVGIAVGACAIVVALWFTGLLSILTLLVLWNFSALAAIVFWERERRNQTLKTGANFSNDDRWSKTKMDLEKVENKLSKAKDPERRKALLRSKSWLENELRRLEWSIRESGLNAMYNAGSAGLRNPKVNKKHPRDLSDHAESSSSVNNNWAYAPDDRLGERWALRKRAQLELEFKERQNLDNALIAAEAIIANEPTESLPEALQPIANDCKAHYNLIKKRVKPKKTPILCDYWIAWSLIQTVQNKLPFDSALEKYASNEFKPKVKKFINSVDAVRYSRIESTPVVDTSSVKDKER
jgi:hypothetical protein